MDEKPRTCRGCGRPSWGRLCWSCFSRGKRNCPSRRRSTRIRQRRRK